MLLHKESNTAMTAIQGKSLYFLYVFGVFFFKDIGDKMDIIVDIKVLSYIVAQNMRVIKYAVLNYSERLYSISNI